MSKKVLISEKVNQKLINILEENSLLVDYKPELKKDELLNIIRDYQILIVRSATQANAEVISHGKNLELIGRAGTGVDNVDVDAATRKGIIVMNTPGGNTISAAEHTFSMMLSLCRKIPQADRSMKEKKWDRKSFSGTELLGKNLGVIGLGKIGREVAIRAKAFGMNILGYDPLLAGDVANEMGIKLLPLESLIKESDIITLHVPLTDETKYILSEKSLAQCKDGVKIVNCARGGLIDEAALLNSLNSGKVSGAALDVFENEPPQNFDLINHSKVVCTPHLGASTEEAQEKVAIQLAQQIVDWNSGKEVIGNVNAASIKMLLDEKIRPFAELAERIGTFHSQLIPANITKIILTTAGPYLSKNSELLKVALLKGLLKNLVAEPVNFVNASAIAEEMGIHIEEIKSQPDGIYSNLFSAEIKSKEDGKTISGTVLINNDYRIVSFDGYQIEFKPEGNILIYYNIDKPGVLSKVSTLLAKSSINIAGLSLSRSGKGKKAVTIINIDEAADKNILDGMKKLEEVEDVYFVGF